MNKNIIFIFLIVFLALPLCSALEIDNVKDYNPVLKEVTIINSFDIPLLRSDIAKVQLLTPLDYHVAPGYGEIARIEIETFDETYLNALGIMDFYDKNIKYDKFDSENKIEQEFDYKYLTYEDVIVNDYETICEKEIVSEKELDSKLILDDKLNTTNTTQTCSQIIVGSHIETREVWNDITSKDMIKGKMIIGIFTDVKLGDKKEWIPTWYGVRISEFASWTADLNVKLVSYYKLDESNGNALDSKGSINGTVNGATQGVTGKINTAYDFDGTSDDVNLGACNNFARTDGLLSISVWLNLDTINEGNYILGNWNGGAFIQGDVRFDMGGDSKFRAQFGQAGGSTLAYISTNTYASLQGNWEMVTITINTSNSNDDKIRLYIGDTKVLFTAEGGQEGTGGSLMDNANNLLIAALDLPTENYNGKIDELSFWSKELTQAEITQLYNGGTGITYTDVFDSIETNLISPENNTIFGTNNINFQCNSSSETEMANISLIIDDVIVLINSTGGLLNLSIDSNQVLSEGNHNWTCQGINNNLLNETADIKVLEIDTTSPIITINKPLNQTYTFSELNYYNVTTNELVDTCYFELESVEYNMTTSDNLTWIRENNISQSQGNHTALFTCKDNVDNTGFKTAEYNLQYINLNSPEDNLLINNTEVTFNISISTITNNDISNVSLYTNESGSFGIKETSLFNRELIINKTSADQDTNGDTNFHLLTDMNINSYINNISQDVSSTASANVIGYWVFAYNNGTNFTTATQSVANSGSFTFTPSDENKSIYNIKFYLKKSSGISGTISSSNLLIYGKNITSNMIQTWDFNITNDTLWDGEVCYIDGNCYFAESNYTLLTNKISPSITITSPVTSYGSLANGDSIDLNVTTTTNGTLDTCQYEYNSVNNTISCNVNTTFTYVSGSNNLTYCVNDTLGNEGCDGGSWTIISEILNIEYDLETTEGLQNIYEIDVKVKSGSSLTQSIFEYNGTNYTTNVFSSGDIYNISSTITIPPILSDVNLSFKFYFVIDGITYASLSYEQLVQDISFGVCGGGDDVLLGLILLDEIDQTNLTGNIEFNGQLTNKFSDTIIDSANITFNNTGFGEVCLTPNSSYDDYYFYSEIKYSADNHVPEFYTIQKAELSTYPKNISLYDLNSSSSTEFLIKYQDDNLIAVEGAIVQLSRKYIGEDAYKLVEAPLTSNIGTAIVHIDLNTNLYKAIVVKNGEVLDIFPNLVFNCENELSGQCTENLFGNVDPQNSVSVEQLNDFSFQVTESNQTITTTYSIPSGSPSEVNIVLTQVDSFGDKSMCNQTITSSSGSIDCEYNNTIGQSMVYLEINKDGTNYAQKSYIISDSTDVDWLDNNLFIGLILLLSLAGMALTSPEWVVINGAITFVLAGGLFLINGVDFVIGLGSLIWLVGASIILITKLSKQEDR